MSEKNEVEFGWVALAVILVIALIAMYVGGVNRDRQDLRELKQAFDRTKWTSTRVLYASGVKQSFLIVPVRAEVIEHVKDNGSLVVRSEKGEFPDEENFYVPSTDFSINWTDIHRLSGTD